MTCALESPNRPRAVLADETQGMHIRPIAAAVALFICTFKHDAKFGRLSR